MKILAISVLVVVAIFLVLYVTRVGRRRLAQRTTTLVPVPPRLPDGAPSAGADAAGGDAADHVGHLRFGPVEAVYVSTTMHGDWLARVGAHGLGDRSRAVVSVHDGGVVIERVGAEDLWIPVSTIRGAGLAPGMAGKYVGADGLVVLTWGVPASEEVESAEVDTGLRTRQARDRGGLVDAVRHLTAARSQRPSRPGGAHSAPTSDHQNNPNQQEAR